MSPEFDHRPVFGPPDNLPAQPVEQPRPVLPVQESWRLARIGDTTLHATNSDDPHSTTYNPEGHQATDVPPPVQAASAEQPTSQPQPEQLDQPELAPPFPTEAPEPDLVPSNPADTIYPQQDLAQTSTEPQQPTDIDGTTAQPDPTDTDTQPEEPETPEPAPEQRVWNKGELRSAVRQTIAIAEAHGVNVEQAVRGGPHSSSNPSALTNQIIDRLLDPNNTQDMHEIGKELASESDNRNLGVYVSQVAKRVIDRVTNVVPPEAKDQLPQPTGPIKQQLSTQDIQDSAGQDLNAIRQELGFTLQELADVTGISVPSMSRFMNGITHPDMEVVETILDVFNLKRYREDTILWKYRNEVDEINAHMARDVPARIRRDAPHDTESAGYQLNQIRMEENIPIARIADATGMSVSKIQRILSGLVHPHVMSFKEIIKHIGAPTEVTEPLIQRYAQERNDRIREAVRKRAESRLRNLQQEHE